MKTILEGLARLIWGMTAAAVKERDLCYLKRVAYSECMAVAGADVREPMTNRALCLWCGMLA